MPTPINVGDSQAIVRQKILDILTYHNLSVSGIASWGIARTRLNFAATSLGLPTFANSESGSTVRAKINAINSATALSAPVNTVAPSITGTATLGQVLTAVNGTWTGYPAPVLTRQWKRNGANIGGATGPTYTLVEADLGAVITLTVTAVNNQGSASATSTATSAVVTIPINTVLPVITGTATNYETLSATLGTWTAYPAATYEYQWQADGVDISGKTANTLILTSDLIGKEITIEVTATNTVGDTIAESLPTAEIAALPIPALFEDAERGVWFDPSDLSTLYQNQEMSPVVEGSPVGLMLDKHFWGDRTLQEVWENTTDMQSSWTTGGVFAVDNGDGSYNIRGDNTNPGYIDQQFTTVANKFYRIEVLSENSNMGIRVGTTQGASNLWDSSQGSNSTKSYWILSSGSTMWVRLYKTPNSITKVTPIRIGEYGGSVAISGGGQRPTLLYEDGKAYLNFDGTDDSLYTDLFDLTNTDEISIFTAMIKNNETPTGTIVEFGSSVSVANGTFRLATNSATANLSFNVRGTTEGSRIISQAANTKFVVSAIAKIGTNFRVVRLDGVAGGTLNSDSGTGNFSSQRLNVGRRNNSSLPFNGKLWNLIIRDKVTSDQLLTDTEKYVAQQQGRNL